MKARSKAWIVLLGIALLQCPATSFEILYFVAPTGEECAFEIEENEPLSRGVLDVSMARTYSLTPVVDNTLAQGCSGDGRDILIDGANVRIFRGESAEGAPFYTFFQQITAFAPSHGWTVFSFSAVPVQATEALLRFILGVDDVNDLTYADLLGYRDAVTVEVSILGTTTGGDDVETEPATFTVDLCFGCLVECTTESIDEDTGQYCESLAAPSQIPCSLGQDQAFDCRFCAPTYGIDECQALCEE